MIDNNQLLNPSGNKLAVPSLQEAIKGLPWYGILIGMSPQICKVATVMVAGVQFDLLLYGLAIFLGMFRPNLLLNKTALIIALVAAFSLLPWALVCEPPLTARSVVDVLALWTVMTCVLSILERNNILLVFSVYFWSSVIVAVWGILELIWNVSGTQAVNGLSFEQSHYVIVALPAVYASMVLSGLPVWIRVVMPLSILLTFSTTGVCAILFLVLVLGRKAIFLSLALATVLIAVVSTNHDFREHIETRVLDDSVSILEGAQSFGSNKTTASFISNGHVAWISLKRNFPFGAGFGNHRMMYDSVLSSTNFSHSSFFGTNRSSGHNLLIRVVSEFGFIGLCTIVLFLFRTRNSLLTMSAAQRFLVVAGGTHFVAKSIKLGSYLDYGTPVFAGFILCTLFLPMSGGTATPKANER